MIKNKNQEILGILIAVLGLLFLLVNNRLLWFGWEAIWPMFPFLAGVFLLHLYTTGKQPAMLFWGLSLTQIGVFLFLFSVGILPWDAMRTLWPFFPLMAGIGLLALAGIGERTTSSLVVGVVVVIAAVVGFWVVQGAGGDRVLAPLIRLWPVVLIIAGALVFLRARRERRELEDSHQPTGGDSES